MALSELRFMQHLSRNSELFHCINISGRLNLLKEGNLMLTPPKPKPKPQTTLNSTHPGTSEPPSLSKPRGSGASQLYVMRPNAKHRSLTPITMMMPYGETSSCDSPMSMIVFAVASCCHYITMITTTNLLHCCCFLSMYDCVTFCL